MDPIPLFDQRTLAIKEFGQKGRGIVTTVKIAARTVIDISPILLFPTEEYHQHGQFTQLDHYTYRWQGGMALALGLGSMFNHSRTPNVGFQRDFDQKLIRYSAMRDIEAGEELCISYGPNLWFPDMDGNGMHTPASDVSLSDEETADSFMSRLQLMDDDSEEEDEQSISQAGGKE